MKKAYIAVGVAVLIFIGGAIYIATSNSGNTDTGTTSAVKESTNPYANEATTTTAVVSATTTTTASPTSFTIAQVQTHNSKQSCWTIVNNSVYDVTTWISQHPGGAGAILSMCGKDGSAAFEDQHGGQRRPANELASFKIGTLSK